ncbi:two-component sensor histidine kinase [Microbispora rosea subsp. aerata]|nr:sensor histidine kinase [Microbispora rosea]GGO25125.1 two-component sensor histidine kinase [Microbispora rosea subsp. aerata]GIH57944.1 two-component sensor histidine kinase [Microbispora rosea subsp. aerata]GLJ81441.1 two-component sensor histidine kinase [Microbispora rosea subsp. aerata]
MRTTPGSWRSWLRAHPLVSDSILAVVLTAASLWWILATGPAEAGWLPSAPPRPADALNLALAAACTLPVALRRSRPLVLAVAVCVPETALNMLHYDPGLSAVGKLVLLYSVAAYRGLALSLIALVVFLFDYVAGAAAGILAPSWTDHVIVTAVLLLCWVCGRAVRLRRAYLAELVQRADRLERAREADTRAARAEERSRIARELHDVVAHHVSVMTVQAAAARKMLDVKPDVARDALTAIEEMGRTAMAEMRSIVGVLRTDGPAERGPQPGMDDLPALVEQMREAGLRTELSIEGERRSLPPGVDLAAYRLVQEALTNSLRHAGPAARAWVTVRHEPNELTVHVEDDGRGAAEESLRIGGKGHGLVGIRERVALYGGVLRIGPRIGGGFEVHARFPLKHSPLTDSRPTNSPLKDRA